MQSLPANVNPFALMLDPQAVFAKIECSERLERLHRRVCRPLDKPLLGAVADEGSEAGPGVEDAVASDVPNGFDDLISGSNPAD